MSSLVYVLAGFWDEFDGDADAIAETHGEEEDDEEEDCEDDTWGKDKTKQNVLLKTTKYR